MQPFPLGFCERDALHLPREQGAVLHVRNEKLGEMPQPVRVVQPRLMAQAVERNQLELGGLCVLPVVCQTFKVRALRNNSSVKKQGPRVSRV